MTECKRILAIHIYRSALLPALVTAFVQFVRFQHRPLPSTFCSTSTHARAHTRTRVFHLFLYMPSPLLPFLSLSLSVELSTAISRIYLSVSAPPFRPFFADSSPLRSARIVVFVALVGVVAKVRWSDGERAKERQRYRILCPVERTSVTRKNICVIIYYLERKIEIFRRSGTALRGHTNDNNSRPATNYTFNFY